MTRGKHARAANVRREAHEQAAEIGTYQRKVAELVAENKKLKEEAKKQSDSHRQQIARLAVQIREGTSSALMAAEHELRTLREERDHAQRYAKDILKHWDSIVVGLLDHAIDVHHMDRLGALEWLTGLSNSDEAFALSLKALGKTGRTEKLPGDSVKASVARSARERRIRNIRSLRADYEQQHHSA